MGEPLSIRNDRAVIRLCRGQIALPVSLPPIDRALDLAEEEPVHSLDELRREVAPQFKGCGPGQGLSADRRFRRRQYDGQNQETS